MAKYEDIFILDDKVSPVLKNIAVQFSKVQAVAVKAQTQIQKMHSSLQATGNKMTSIGNSMIGVSLATGAFLKTSLDAWEGQAAATAILENSLKSREKSLGRTAEQIGKMASAIQENSIFADEEIIQNITNQLLTFDKINGKTFDRANQAVIDMGSKLFGVNATAEKMRPIALGLGKALQNPAEAMNSLGRAGVKFSKAEQDVVKGLIAANRAAEAQEFILKAVESRYGGAAEQLGNTQPLKKLANAFNDAQEPIGKIVEDFLIPLVNIATKLLKWFNALPMPIKTFGVVLAGIVALAAPVLIVLGGIISALGGVGIAIAAVIAVITVLALNWKKIWGGILAVTKSIVSGIMAVLKPLIDAIMWIINQLPMVKLGKAIVGGVQGAMAGNQSSNKNITVNNNYAFKTGAIKVREEADIDKISMKLSDHLFNASKNMGYSY